MIDLFSPRLAGPRGIHRTKPELGCGLTATTRISGQSVAIPDCPARMPSTLNALFSHFLISFGQQETFFLFFPLSNSAS